MFSVKLKVNKSSSTHLLVQSKSLTDAHDQFTYCFNSKVSDQLQIRLTRLSNPNFTSTTIEFLKVPIQYSLLRRSIGDARLLHRKSFKLSVIKYKCCMHWRLMREGLEPGNGDDELRS